MSSEMMNDVSRDITRLTEIWYRLVNRDHHKDRDCHWGIDMTWSYGNNPVFRVWHEGYVHDRVELKKSSMFAALTALQSEIRRAISDYLDWAQDDQWGEEVMSTEEADSIRAEVEGVNDF